MSVAVASASPGAARVGVGGPVGSGKTALIERMIPVFGRRGTEVAVVTNDLVTQEDAERLRASGLIAPERGCSDGSSSSSRGDAGLLREVAVLVSSVTSRASPSIRSASSGGAPRVLSMLLVNGVPMLDALRLSAARIMSDWTIASSR